MSVSDWLCQRKRYRARLTAIVIAPVTLRLTPWSSTWGIHGKLLLWVICAFGNLRVSSPGELEAFTRCLILENISVSRVHRGRPKLVRTSSTWVSCHGSSSVVELWLKAPIGSFIDNPAIFIESPNLLGISWARLIVDKKRSRLRHIVTSVHLDALIIALINHVTTWNHLTVILYVDMRVRTTAWSHAKRTRARIVTVSNHTLSVFILNSVKALLNTISAPATLWLKRPLHGASVATSFKRNFATTSREARILRYITESAIRAVLIILVTCTVAILSMKTTNAWVLAGALNACTPLVLISSHLTRSLNIGAVKFHTTFTGLHVENSKIVIVSS